MLFQNNNKQGFTLIELMVSITIITILLMVVMAVLGSFLKSQQTVQTVEALQNSNFIIANDIIQEVRWSTEAIIENSNPDLHNLIITNKDGYEVIYFITDQKLYKEVDGKQELLTPANVQVAKFLVKNDARSDEVPLLKFTITLEGLRQGEPISAQNSFWVSLRQKEVVF